MKIMYNKEELIKACLGEIENDIVLKNLKIVNVITGEILEGHIGIYAGFISYVEYAKQCSIKAKATYDYNWQKYALPGLVDSHVHIESSMLVPREFCRTVLPFGVTTVITDCHEVTNVTGIAGIKYMIESSEDLPQKQYFLLPSSVPAVRGREDAGAELYIEDFQDLFKAYPHRILGVAEMMDFLDVIKCGKRAMDYIAWAQDNQLFVQGHYPFGLGRNIAAYKIAGVSSCHENFIPQEIADKARYGINVDCRNTTFANSSKDVANFYNQVRFQSSLSYCSDDREVDDLTAGGSLNYVLNQAIQDGIHPLDAIRNASYNAAMHVNLENVGAIAPGFTADVIIADSIENIKAEAVFAKGELVAQAGSLVVDIADKDYQLEALDTINIPELRFEDFQVKANSEKTEMVANVIVSLPGSAILEHEKISLPVKSGYLDLSGQDDIRYLAVIYRYGSEFKPCIGLIKNFGLKQGAVASTVAHDSHNLVIVYDSPENALACVGEIKKNRGGLVCCKAGQIVSSLQLEVAGIMTKTKAFELAHKVKQLKAAFKDIGIDNSVNPIGPIMLLALPVIQKLRITNRGLVNVDTQEFVPLFAE